jgi:outer membrane receptor for ferrienterochelin and colicin
MGADLTGEFYRQEFLMDSTIALGLDDIQPTLFLEPEIKVSDKLAIRLGARAEYSSLLEDAALLPRLSAAYKTGKYSQVSLAWGKFRQKPENEILRFAPGLTAERADHYILNFQYKKNRRTFRVETYLKHYADLVKYSEPNSPDPADYNNSGKGYAGGVDLFWRDRETLEGVDYWISYSYLNTTRDYKDYPKSVMPAYASAHNLSVVYKQFLAPISTFVGATYSFASGRPYDDKNSLDFMSQRTKSYNDISLSLTYLTRIFRKDCIVHMNISNLLGFKNVFGYLYSGTPGEDGRYASQAIIPTTGRSAILVFIVMI